MYADYEILDYSARLSFRDAHGLDARYDCYQLIRVLDPNLLSIREHIWGDGDLLFAYASPSLPNVSANSEHGRTVLVSHLSKPIGAGDELEFRFVRHIHHGFKDTAEWWEYTPFVPTHRVRLTIAFPVGREVDRLVVATTPGARSPFVSRPGTKELTMLIDSPSVGSIYRTDWTW